MLKVDERLSDALASMQHHRIVYLVAVGVTLGAYLDFTHTHGTEILYPPGTNHWRGILTFAFVYSVPGWLFTLWCLATGHPAKPVSYRVSVPLTLIMAALYMVTSYGDEILGLDATHKLALVAGASVAFWWLWDSSWQGFVGSFLAACLGCFVEHTLCEIGSMHYVVAELGRVPYWLLALYSLSAVTWGQCARRILTDPAPVLHVRRL